MQFTRSLSSAGRASKWKSCLQSLEKAFLSHLQLDAFAYSASINACDRGAKWPKALYLGRQMLLQTIQLDTACYAASLSLVARQERWPQAMQLMEEIRMKWLTPSITACANALMAFTYPQWQPALEAVFTAVTYWRLAPDPILANQLLNCVEASETSVLRQMQLLKIQLDVVSYNALLSSAAASAAWKGALEVMQRMATEDQASDHVSMTCLCAAAKNAQHWRLATQLADALAPTNSAATAARRAGRWRTSLALIADLQLRFAETDISSFNEEVGAWGVAQWPKALWLTFSKPKKSRDEVILTVLLSSLLGASEFAQALVLLEDPKLRSDPINYQACLRTAVGEHEDEVVTTLLERLRREGLPLPSRCVSELLQQASRSISWRLFDAAPRAKGASLWLTRWPRWLDATRLIQSLGHNGLEADAVLAADVARCFFESSLPWLEAVATLTQMQRDHVRLDVKSSNSIADSGISASCWHFSVGLLQSLHTRRQPWSLVSYTTFIAASEWMKTLVVLKQLRKQGIRLDTVGFNGALGSVADSSWREGMAMMLAEEAAGSDVDVRSFSAVLSSSDWRNAIRIVMRMLQRRVVPDRIASDIAIGSVGKAKVAKALDLLVLLQHESLEVGSRAAISSCASAARWATSLQLLSGTEDTISYGAAIASCEKAQRWEVAFLLLQRAGTATSPMFNSCISACRRGKQWHSALELREQLQSSDGLQADAVTLGALVSCCDKALQWRWAIESFRHQHFVASDVAYNAAVSALQTSMKWHQAIDAKNEMIQKSVQSDVLTIISLVGASRSWEHSLLLLGGADFPAEVAACWDPILADCERRLHWSPVPGLLEELALLEWHFLAKKSGCQMLPNTSVSQ